MDDSHLSNTQNESLEVAIKEELDFAQDEHCITTQIKVEQDDNPFEDVQLQVKEEELITEDIPLDLSNDMSTDKHTITTKTDYDSIEQEDVKMVEGVDANVELKQEMQMGDESLVSYDYPSFEDSMDSNEAAALGNVEACLQEEINMKMEREISFRELQKKQQYGKIKVKNESELTVTETHLISNKLINTTSTVTHPQDGIIESQTTKTLVMEILPMMITRTGITLPKISNEAEEILPTRTVDYNMDYGDFQLNSITGNVLSLEQEAYGLLKANGKKKIFKKKELNCPKCTNTYTNSNAFKKHLAVHNTIENYANGRIKGKKTRLKNQAKKRRLMLKLEREEELEKPMSNVKKEGYECTCGKVFQRRSRLETCLRSHNEYTENVKSCFPCMACSRTFKDKNELILHRKKIHRKRFPCKFCPTDYNSRKKLFKHLQVHQKVQLMEYKVITEVMKGKQKLRCFMCSKTCNELSQLKHHVMDDHKEPYICLHCDLTFPKIIDFGNHTKTYHPEVEGQSVLDVLEAFSKLVRAWKCEECDLQFHEADKLALHKIEKHNPDVKPESQFQCTDCRRVFISQKGLTSHRRIHHSTETNEIAEIAEKGVLCLECRKICKDMSALTSHMRLHSPERKYACKFCDFRFATPEKRKAHAEVHTGDMKYVCFICEYQCSSENRLKRHKISLKHINMKEYLLTGKPLIEEETPVTEKKKEKIKDSSGERKSEGKKKKKEKRNLSSSSEVASTCDICGDSFPSESEMLEHKQTHPFIEFPNDDKPSRIFFK